MQRHVICCFQQRKSDKTRSAEVSNYVFWKEVIDRENTRKKRKTHVVETRKQEEKKETTDELMDEQRRTQRGRKEVMHACERDNSKSFFF